MPGPGAWPTIRRVKPTTGNILLIAALLLPACRPELRRDTSPVPRPPRRPAPAIKPARPAPPAAPRQRGPLLVGVFESPSAGEVEQAIRIFQLNRSIDGPVRNQAWGPFLEVMFAYLGQPAARLQITPLIRARVAAEFELDADRRRGEDDAEIARAVAVLLGRIDRKMARIRRLKQKGRYHPRQPSPDGLISWPLTYGLITSGFGKRRDPLRRDQVRFHAGIDLAAAPNEPVYAAFGGEVILAGWNGGFGRMVRIRHPGGLETLYAHLAVILVKEGQQVTRGEVVGLLGNSGRTTGHHLHFAVYREGKPVDPLSVLPTGKLRYSDLLPGASFGDDDW